jgi:alkanesulfonate monooxygenase SsuD/methylene tetrahydromethanopterin reductase-like flavin-dependent oxidoreductase (luciferase family)
MVNVGLYFDLRNPPPWRQDWARLYGFTLEMCEEADRLGAHSLWVTEHHQFEDGYLTQPLTFAAAVAARTRSARVGIAVTLAPFRSAVHLAEEAAVVDLVSGGRLELGLGTGYRSPEFKLHGADMGSRYATTDERAGEIRALWSDGSLPPPMAQTSPRIWMGYQGPRGARRAGLLGESLLSANPALAAPYRDGLVEGGHDPASARMAGGIGGFITEDPDSNWPLVAKHLAYQWDSYNRYRVEGTDEPAPKPIDPDRWRTRGLGPSHNNFLYATPSVAAEAIAAHVAGTPIETVWFFASIAGMPEDVVARHVQTICTRLAPMLAGRPPSPEEP